MTRQGVTKALFVFLFIVVHFCSVANISYAPYYEISLERDSITTPSRFVVVEKQQDGAYSIVELGQSRSTALQLTVSQHFNEVLFTSLNKTATSPEVGASAVIFSVVGQELLSSSPKTEGYRFLTASDKGVVTCQGFVNETTETASLRKVDIALRIMIDHFPFPSLMQNVNIVATIDRSKNNLLHTVEYVATTDNRSIHYTLRARFVAPRTN